MSHLGDSVAEPPRLAESLRRQDKDKAEIAATDARFQKIWAKADLKITSSCLCRPQM